MYLLSSDYDGTFTGIDSEVRYRIVLNIEAIERFREKGHKFILNTGRSFESINHEINDLKSENIKIKYDYLSCYDGNLLLSSENDTIYINSLDDYLKYSVNKIVTDNKNIGYQYYTYQNQIIECGIFVPKEYNLEPAINELCQEQALGYRKYSGYTVINGKIRHTNCYFLNTMNINKSTPIFYLGKTLDIPKENIYTIGDDLNDFEMIRDFNGYAMPWAKHAIKSIAQGTCPSVAKLVKKLTK